MSMLALLVMASTLHQTLTLPPLQREFRAAWVATVVNIDWPSKPGIPTQQAKNEMLAILDRCKELHFNAVVWQVRPSCDAFYPSSLEPWSEYLTGRAGKAPDPMWDPLEFGIAEAHRRGLEFHAWFNPYRAKHKLQKTEPSYNHISNTKPSIVKKYGGFLWLDPGEKETQRHSLAVMLDVVKRYDVDGIHIDDYFYPYKEKDSSGNMIEFPDDRSYGAYRAAGGKMSRDNWRRANVDGFVQDVYEGIHKIKPWVKFGISPFGIYRPGYPSSIKAGMDQYADLYADPLKWLQKGWCDYMAPQLYWKINPAAQSYPVLLRWWVEQNIKKRHLWIGNYTSRTDPAEMGSATWPSSEIADQVRVTRDQPGATGNIHFSMRALMHNADGVSDRLATLYAERALVPASPWLGSTRPKRPNLRPTGEGTSGQTSFFWGPGGNGDSLRWVCVYVQRAGKWTADLISAEQSTISVPGKPDAVVITAIDRTGNESDPMAWPAKYRITRD